LPEKCEDLFWKQGSKQGGYIQMDVSINAHMPGLVARVAVSQGEAVKAGQEVAVINCMKTEMSVLSHVNGVVKEILVKEWDEMQVDNPMVILELKQG
jgi:acetyl-CoA carboxylase biotin carboxyl carrier protein